MNRLNTNKLNSFLANLSRISPNHQVKINTTLMLLPVSKYQTHQFKNIMIKSGLTKIGKQI